MTMVEDTNVLLKPYKYSLASISVLIIQLRKVYVTSMSCMLTSIYLEGKLHDFKLKWFLCKRIIFMEYAYGIS